MSGGRPVIAPSEGCIPEEVGDTGFLYDPASEDGLATAIEEALCDSSNLEELGASARRRAEQASPSLIAEQIVEAYESVLCEF